MIKIELYECGVCHTRYKSKDECTECEESHVKPKRIEGAKWVAKKNDSSGYPYRVTIEFEDGETIEYRR